MEDSRVESAYDNDKQAECWIAKLPLFTDLCLFMLALLDKDRERFAIARTVCKCTA